MKTTIGTLLTRALKRYEGRPSYLASKAAVAHLSGYFGDMPADRLRARHLSAYRRSRSGVTPATRNREVGFLRTVMRDAVDRYSLRIVLPVSWGKEKEAVRYRTLTKAEAVGLIRYLDAEHSWSADMVRVLLGTGMRIGELLGAFSADFEDMVDCGRLFVPTPKEGTPKVVVIEGWALEALRRLMALPRGPGEYGSKALRYHMARFCRREGVSLIRPHDLRRTYGSWAIRNGATLEQVGQSLGHQCVETTRRAYARLDENSRRRVTGLVNGEVDLSSPMDAAP